MKTRITLRFITHITGNKTPNNKSLLNCNYTPYYPYNFPHLILGQFRKHRQRQTPLRHGFSIGQTNPRTILGKYLLLVQWHWVLNCTGDIGFLQGRHNIVALVAE